MEYQKTIVDVVIAMIRASLHNQKIDERLLSDIDLDQLFDLCYRHQITALAAYSLTKPDNRWEGALLESIRRTALFDDERNKILSCFEKEQIWYCCLKGIVLKNYYPAYGLREMSDNDILFDSNKDEEVRRIMETIGYKTSSFAETNHDVYHKKPIFNFEMHRDLFQTHYNDLFYQYFSPIKERLLANKEKNYEYLFDPNDFYVYIISHIFKHYDGFGTGLRSLIDIYVYVKNNKLDWDYISKEMSKLELNAFEHDIRSLSFDLFDDKRLTEKEESDLEYIISSGVYGTTENRAKTKIGKIGKIRYVIDRLSVPQKETDPRYVFFKKEYPFFYEHRILLPLLPMHRLIKSIIVKREKVRIELKSLLKYKKLNKS